MKAVTRSFALSLAVWLVCAMAASPAAAVTAHYPVKISGNVYRLGNPAPGTKFSFENAAYLITTHEGHLLINSGWPDAPANQELLSPALIRRQMQQLGFRFADIKILLLSHAHHDHFGGHADIRRETGARVMVMAGDDEAVRSGVVPFDGVRVRYVNPCPVDEVLRDGSVVELGGVRLTAHHTAGHTQGSTTWELQVREQDRALRVLILDSELSYGSWAQFHSDDPDRWPDRLQGNVRTLRILRGLPADIVLGPHGSRIDGVQAFNEFLDGKRLALLQATQTQLLEATDPDAWRRRISLTQKKFSDWAADPQQRAHFPQVELLAASSGSPARTASQAGTYVSVPKLFIDEHGKAVDAEQGLFLVPENRAKTASRTIAIHFLRFRATDPQGNGDDRQRAPVFLLAGGPGDELDFTRQRDMRMAARLRRTRDVIYVSQRGNPKAPGLVPGLWASQETVSLNQADSPETTRQRQRTSVSRAVEEWSARGVDLSGYDILNIVDDVYQLRSALGYDKIILRGCSFGSQWSLAYLKRWPETVDRALLSGVEPLDHAYDSPQWLWASMSRVTASAESDPRLAAHIPRGGLMHALQGVVGRLEKAAVSVEIENPTTGQPMTVVVGAKDLQEIIGEVGGLMGRTARQNLANWPRFILELHGGDYRFLAARSWMRRTSEGRSPLIIALIDNSLGITARRDKLLQSEPAARWLGDINDFYRNTRDLVPTPNVGDAFRTSSRIAVPVLLLNGDFDWSTPIENSKELLSVLDQGHLVTVNGGTHCTEWQESFSQELPPQSLEAIHEFIDVDFRKTSADEFFRSLPEALAYPRLPFNTPDGPPLYEQWVAKQKSGRP